MLVIIKHADMIAGLDDLVRESNGEIDLQMRFYGSIDTAWFRQHLGHNLLPVNEYGRLLNQCHDYAPCDDCEHRYPCVLEDGHEGPHRRKGA